MGTLPGIYIDKDADRDRAYLEEEAKKIALYFTKRLPLKNTLWLFYYPARMNQYLLDALGMKIIAGREAPNANAGQLLAVFRR